MQTHITQISSHPQNHGKNWKPSNVSSCLWLGPQAPVYTLELKRQELYSMNIFFEVSLENHWKASATQRVRRAWCWVLSIHRSLHPWCYTTQRSGTEKQSWKAFTCSQPFKRNYQMSSSMKLVEREGSATHLRHEISLFTIHWPCWLLSTLRPHLRRVLLSIPADLLISRSVNSTFFSLSSLFSVAFDFVKASFPLTFSYFDPVILHCPHFLVHLWDSLFLPPFDARQNSECFVLQILLSWMDLLKKSPLNDFFWVHTSSRTSVMHELCLRSSSDSNFITFTLDLLSFLQNTLGFITHLCTFASSTSQNHVWLFFITCVNSSELHVLSTINYLVYVMINTLLIMYQ